MIYLGYLVSVAIVIILAVNAARYANMLDRNSKLAGAFIGAVILAVVTSMPEFFTSISAVTVFNMPDFPAGNILGSNIFNLVIVSAAILIYRKKFSKAKISGIYVRVGVILLVMYALVASVFGDIITFKIGHASVMSPIIIVVYLIVIAYIAHAHDDVADESALKYIASIDCPLDAKQAVRRLVITGLLLVLASAAMTYTAGLITIEWGIEGGFAGAIFLGIATSVPELASLITLFRVKNYDIAIGSMVGSNVFNFSILALADIICRENMYLVGQAKTPVMVITGIITTAIFLFMLMERKHSKKIEVVCPVLILACYAAFFFI